MSARPADPIGPLAGDARHTLERYRDHVGDPEQRALARDFLAFLDRHPDAMRRACVPGHLTASALVLDASAERVLLTHHPRFGRWLQLGGHCEDEDRTLAGAAAREAREESGITGLGEPIGPVRLHRHRVPCHGGSWHLDVQYVLRAPAGAREVCSEESIELGWFGPGELPGSADRSVRDLVRAAYDAARD